jgi:putative transposase
MPLSINEQKYTDKIYKLQLHRCIWFMKHLYQNKFRIETSRLSGHDYTSKSMYFITICCKHKISYFGEIFAGKIYLSPIGNIIDQYWQEIPIHFPMVKLDCFVIMPDHMHGIIIINNNNILSNDNPNLVQHVETPNLGVSTENKNTENKNTENKNTENKNPNWKPNCLGSIINQFKRKCTIEIKNHGYEFHWQSRFHDHVIRSYAELDRIRQYIIDNPKNV